MQPLGSLGRRLIGQRIFRLQWSKNEDEDNDEDEYD
jgi:hypothetical protein